MNTRQTAAARGQSGFTLVEIAIVLVIIGLLLGGVLKGQELINSAKVKNFATDFRNIPLFIYGYQDRHRAIPGDDRNADTHLDGGIVAEPEASTANGAIDGAWDTEDETLESYLFWQHVRLAQLVSGSTTPGADGYAPTNADGGRIGIESDNATPFITGLRGAYVVCSAGIQGRYVVQLDRSLDDGNTATGSMRAVPSNAGRGTAGADMEDVVENPGGAYTVCMSV
jgi:prepilin-type N-terminal cleavage/methylation domain-containing protein